MESTLHLEFRSTRDLGEIQGIRFREFGSVWVLGFIEFSSVGFIGLSSVGF